MAGWRSTVLQELRPVPFDGVVWSLAGVVDGRYSDGLVVDLSFQIGDLLDRLGPLHSFLCFIALEFELLINVFEKSLLTVAWKQRFSLLLHLFRRLKKVELFSQNAVYLPDLVLLEGSFAQGLLILKPLPEFSLHPSHMPCLIVDVF